ncbi:hypothetical protein BT96DRAFT_988091 [Gymnopus androsaceus JB14]|uniref:Uncharacterized protein n=1 Tax=Gymnopus androsaceus JB14 TaxID=1447944 RepID=A0A6A4I952_9AGAR|nr:hypothetical protein BT96DRAFT_988091 [Gymnopus androsaceus JB14]
MLSISKLLLASSSVKTPSALSTEAVIPVSGLQMDVTVLSTCRTTKTRAAVQSSNLTFQMPLHITIPGSSVSSDVVIPMSSVRSNSPIAVTGLVDESDSDAWSSICVVFFSPENILSEYVFTLEMQVS